MGGGNEPPLSGRAFLDAEGLQQPNRPQLRPKSFFSPLYTGDARKKDITEQCMEWSFALIILIVPIMQLMAESMF